MLNWAIYVKKGHVKKDIGIHLITVHLKTDTDIVSHSLFRQFSLMSAVMCLKFMTDLYYFEQGNAGTLIYDLSYFLFHIAGYMTINFLYTF